ncbi:uncharacterized protein BP01DRAFT_389732 [Aspergillus saccharolyticus JOP 1030-1]|uniref:Uncharacterized protein n=1 Tax=Aspergillus saccharolyticus JOP 1030-1 TaxID=1450539 RepID=A0A318ZJW4_9EURO|nr:hypothetical protein BP01DRAFT_389732 [Aspergillus saccharolyticus JOP 1030-1]PYH47829.1 hypothetical protein BP01DRAFT_389732 [Aspergillus saccharolyticus JOP 1030-1]
MHFPSSSTVPLFWIISSTLALPSSTYSQLDTRDVLRPRNWDFRLFSAGCDPNTTSLDVSLWHRQGVSATGGCATLETSVNLTQVETFSWKSPGASQYDLCLYGAGCATKGGEGAGTVQVVRSGWEVCQAYMGWRGWGVVAHGGEC